MGLGIHVKKAGFPTTADAILAMKNVFPIQCAQIFVAMNSEHDVKIGNTRKTNIPILVHVAHIGNVWSNTHWNWKFFLHQLKLATAINAPLVVHLPLRPISDIVAVCKDMQKRVPGGSRLLFENPASSKPGTCWGDPKRVRKFVYQMEGIDLDWGLCIDTAHLWSSLPQSDTIATKAGTDKWLAGIGIRARSKIKAIHLNGSYERAGSGVDKHAIPGGPQDSIWNSETAGSLPQWMEFAKRMPVVIEWNRGHCRYIKNLFDEWKKLGKKIVEV